MTESLITYRPSLQLPPAPEEAEIIVPESVAPKLRKYKDKGASARRRFPIHAYIGANGSGKSLAAVHDSLYSLNNGRRVLSTVALLDPTTGEEHPNYERLTEWSQMLEAEHCDVLFDEVLGIANSRASHGMPVQVTVLLNQLRRRDIVLRWTAPAWARADKVIRECTQAVTVCKGWMGKTIEGPAASTGEIPMWKAKRLFRWVTYDALDFEEWTLAKESKLSALNKSWFWGPDSPAFHSYRTLDPVSRVGEVLEGGTCAHCGGAKTRPKCSCSQETHRNHG